LSRSAFVFGVTATLYEGFGNDIAGSVTAASFAQRLSPVCVSASFATAPMSPATTCGTASCVFPVIRYNGPIRSSALLFAFHACESAFSAPENTRKYVSRPTYGSAAVLNTSAVNGFEASAAISLFSSRSGWSTGEGKSDVIESSRRRTPGSFVPLAVSTGTMLPALIPALTPAPNSSSLSDSPSRYLVISVSSVSAASSISFSR
jgi:hypothetical protein